MGWGWWAFIIYYGLGLMAMTTKIIAANKDRKELGIKPVALNVSNTILFLIFALLWPCLL